MQSYYQIAGIHGMPYSPWDGVKGINDFQYGGYCTHTSVIFLTWHRPYLGLYEQALYAQVQEIANSFSDLLKAKYQAAAKTFRIPYWDWAARPANVASAFPSALTTAKIGVIGIDGKPTTIDNPLYTFNFPQSTLSDGEISGTVGPCFRTYVTATE
jgi:tyrosinase